VRMLVRGLLSPPCENNMTEPHHPRLKYVIGPDGSPLTIADLLNRGRRAG
jgi:hypothetical protein